MRVVTVIAVLLLGGAATLEAQHLPGLVRFREPRAQLRV